MGLATLLKILKQVRKRTISRVHAASFGEYEHLYKHVYASVSDAKAKIGVYLD